MMPVNPKATSCFPLVGQPSELLIREILEYAVRWAPRQEIVYRDLLRFTYTDLWQRVQRLARVLQQMGVESGDRVGVMDWDSHRYLELFFAVPMIGAVLHTINVRLTPDQALFTINHAEDKVLFVHSDFLPLLAHLAPHCPMVQRMVLLTEGAPPPGLNFRFAGEYEQLLAAADGTFEFPSFDERTVATLFYTTGTTGQPKGVFFSHRQIVLHTLACCATLGASPRPVNLEASDVYLPLTPMFHVHAWGIPYCAALLGLKQVYPGRFEPHLILQLIQRERVTFSHCVSTLLQMLLHHPESQPVDFRGWKVIVGGGPLPPSLARQAMERHIRIINGYGMSETCPVIAVANLRPDMAAEAERIVDVGTRAGFPVPLTKLQIVDEEGVALPPGSTESGELLLQAPWLTTGYFKEPERSAELWRGGWLHTGDVARLDADGYLRITDRLKDMIKIGGEWISSLELESALSQHPAVRETAVIALPDPKWDERPHALVVLHDAARGKVTSKELAAFLHTFVESGVLHKRAILTHIQLVDAIPKTSVGKQDKKLLRTQHRPPAAS